MWLASIGPCAPDTSPSVWFPRSPVSSCRCCRPAAPGPRPPAPTRDYPFQPVPFTAVTLTDEFWAPRIEINRTATVPVAFEQCELTKPRRPVRAGGAGAARRGAGQPQAARLPVRRLRRLQGDRGRRLHAERPSRSEARCLRRRPDREDRGGAGAGRLSLHDAHHQPAAAASRGPGTERWVLERDDSHELYNLGHLFEAATAHYLATGKRSLLDVAVKAADLLVRTFGPGKRSIWPGHQITEMGLVKMARVTGKPEYLALAKFLLDERGPGPLPPGERANPRGLDYNQAQQRVIEQTEPVGHAVRAMYMYSGMADVAALTGDPTYVHAIDTIWTNTVSTEALHHRRHRRVRRRRGVRQPLPAAEPDRLQRDLRLGRHGLLEPPAVPAPRRREVPRRDGAHALQRAAFPASRSTARPSSIRTRSSRAASTSAARGSASPAARGTSRGSCRRCPATSTRRRRTPST